MALQVGLEIIALVIVVFLLIILMRELHMRRSVRKFRKDTGDLRNQVYLLQTEERNFRDGEYKRVVDENRDMKGKLGMGRAQQKK